MGVSYRPLRPRSATRSASAERESELGQGIDQNVDLPETVRKLPCRRQTEVKAHDPAVVRQSQIGVNIGSAVLSPLVPVYRDPVFKARRLPTVTRR